jgi:hypothetical protein
MKQWYCHLAGQQYGPIDQSVLAARVSQVVPQVSATLPGPAEPNGQA